MAFAKAAGYGNLPNGNFSPIIYSKQVQLAFRKSSVVEDVTNNDYFGEIAQMGDTVKIIKEPEISVKSYTRGAQITAQDLDDEDFSLTIDKSNYFAFKIDDIEEAHSHVNFMQMATDRAAYRLRDQYDQEVLAYLSGYTQSALHGVGDTVNTTVNGTKAVESAGSDELLGNMKLDSVDFGVTDNGAGKAVPIVLVYRALLQSLQLQFPHYKQLRMGRLLDQQLVDTQGRWLVIDPVFAETLKDEQSNLFNSDFGGQTGGIQTVQEHNLHGFRVYVSNNLPTVGTTGPATATTTPSSADFGVIVAGHDSAVATAQQINKTETYRDPDSFADIVRGMHLYGRKILRPEGIVTLVTKLAINRRI